MIKMGKLKKGVYRTSNNLEQRPYKIASRFQRKHIKKDESEKVSPYNTTFKKLPF